MNFLRFITIENLCLAAEITTALLLLALAIPDKKKAAPTPTSTDDSESLRRLETARRAHCQAIVFRGVATLSCDGTLEPAAGRFQPYEPLAVLGWEDRLTKLGNRSFLDTFLEEWLSLPERARNGSLLTMIIVDRYSDLLREKGAIGVEQSLRDLGEKLSKHYEPTALIGRYQPDRFLVIQFERCLPEAHEDFENLLKSLQPPEDPSSTPHAPIPCVASIVELGEEGQSLSSSLDRLDEGVSQALESGASCVSEFEGAWTNKRPMSEQASAGPAPSNNDPIRDSNSERRDRRRAASANSQVNGSSSDRDSSADTQEMESELANDDRSEERSEPLASDERSQEEANAFPPETTDVSAVASSEDIAALFAQINKKKQETTSAPPAESSNDDVVDSDDIAALFAANSPQKAPAPKPVEPPAPPSAVASNDDDVVDSDDIAALFAANEPKKKPDTKQVAPKSENKLNELLSNLHQDVANDDLDSLFANVS
jgi:GGDEF domain-containing protein